MVDFSSNNLTEFPKITSEDLQEIKADQNSISWLATDILKGIPNLLHLDLNYLELTEINYTMFKYTPKLKKLDLSSNFIQNFIDYVMPALEEIDLSENGNSEIKFPLSKIAPKIKKLILSFNNFSHLDIDVFSSSKTLESLDLSGNNLYCDCQLQPFVEWADRQYHIGTVEIINMNEYMCEGPKDLYACLVLQEVPHFDCSSPAPSPRKIEHTGLAIGVAVGITLFVIILFSVLFWRRWRSPNRSERLSRPSVESNSDGNNDTDVVKKDKVWCCLSCKKWLAKESFRDRMFSSYSRTEEQGLMVTTSLPTSPTEVQPPEEIS